MSQRCGDLKDPERSEPNPLACRSAHPVAQHSYGPRVCTLGRRLLTAPTSVVLSQETGGGSQLLAYEQVRIQLRALGHVPRLELSSVAGPAFPALPLAGGQGPGTGGPEEARGVGTSTSLRDGGRCQNWEGWLERRNAGPPPAMTLACSDGQGSQPAPKGCLLSPGKAPRTSP